MTDRAARLSWYRWDSGSIIAGWSCRAYASRPSGVLKDDPPREGCRSLGLVRIRLFVFDLVPGPFGLVERGIRVIRIVGDVGR